MTVYLVHRRRPDSFSDQLCGIFLFRSKADDMVKRLKNDKNDEFDCYVVPYQVDTMEPD